MVEFEIHHRVQNIKGEQMGKTVYYVHPKSQQKMTNKALVDRIVKETSLSAGDVSNALISLSNVVCDALRQGMSIDLAELGNLRLLFPAKMKNSPEELTAENATDRPRILFTPKKAMRQAADEVEISIDHGKVVEALPGNRH